MWGKRESVLHARSRGLCEFDVGGKRREVKKKRQKEMETSLLYSETASELTIAHFQLNGSNQTCTYSNLWWGRSSVGS